MFTRVSHDPNEVNPLGNIPSHSFFEHTPSNGKSKSSAATAATRTVRSKMIKFGTCP